jgi:hypothetical protein
MFGRGRSPIDGGSDLGDCDYRVHGSGKICDPHLVELEFRAGLVRWCNLHCKGEPVEGEGDVACCRGRARSDATAGG